MVLASAFALRLVHVLERRSDIIFTGGELLPATWACAFDLLALLLLLDAEGSLQHAAGAGVALGISAVFTPVILPFAIAAGVLLLARRAPRSALALAVGVALPIVPVTLRNLEYCASGSSSRPTAA